MLKANGKEKNEYDFLIAESNTYYKLFFNELKQFSRTTVKIIKTTTSNIPLYGLKWSNVTKTDILVQKFS